MRAEGMGKTYTPNQHYIQAIELCISDRNKPLLLNSCAEFIPYLVDALLLVRDLSNMLARSLARSLDA